MVIVYIYLSILRINSLWCFQNQNKPNQTCKPNLFFFYFTAYFYCIFTKIISKTFHCHCCNLIQVNQVWQNQKPESMRLEAYIVGQNSRYKYLSILPPPWISVHHYDVVATKSVLLMLLCFVWELSIMTGWERDQELSCPDPALKLPPMY